MPKDEALQTVHGYVEEHAWTMRKTILKLLKVPGLYHLPPVLFSKLTPKFYGETAGLRPRSIRSPAASGASI